MMHASIESGRENPRGAGMVGVFESAERAERALDRLERGGFDLAKLSLIGKDSPSAVHQMGLAVAGMHARLWGDRGMLWNRLADTPAAMALVWVPFVGYVVAVGPVAAVLAGAQWRAPSGAHASALARMLTFAGMSPGEVSTYEAAVRGGQILLLVHAGATEAARARHVVSGMAARTAH